MPIDYTRPSAPAAPAAPVAAPAAAPAAPAPAAPVSLTKSAPTVSLTKRGQSAGRLRVNLNWNARQQPAAGGGFLKRLSAAGARAIDLDLGCLYELADGSKGAVQAVGGSFQNREPGPPVVWLDGDDRSGTNSAGENLFVDLGQLARIKRILVFAFIYEGVPNWAAADAVVTLVPAQGATIEVRLDESKAGAGMCAIAVLENRGGELLVNREVQFFPGHSALDQAFGWGMRWKAGHK
ncbi:hypothetical protein [Lapillicoccus sp.]|uniref:TerD family protein n=1 Tax=Lapillicoccus sp. TaxID=1909287 RepID=UPI0025EB588C|nr:hypothetical protein [Lapillicoccus sp.]